MKRTFADAADRVVLAVDAAKLGARAVAVGLEWEQVDLLVTELDPGDDRLAPYRGRHRRPLRCSILTSFTRTLILGPVGDVHRP